MLTPGVLLGVHFPAYIAGVLDSSVHFEMSVEVVFGGKALAALSTPSVGTGEIEDLAGSGVRRVQVSFQVLLREEAGATDRTDDLLGSVVRGRGDVVGLIQRRSLVIALSRQCLLRSIRCAQSRSI